MERKRFNEEQIIGAQMDGHDEGQIFRGLYA